MQVWKWIVVVNCFQRPHVQTKQNQSCKYYCEIIHILCEYYLVKNHWLEIGNELYLNTECDNLLSLKSFWNYWQWAFNIFFSVPSALFTSVNSRPRKPPINGLKPFVILQKGIEDCFDNRVGRLSLHLECLVPLYM